MSRSNKNHVASFVYGDLGAAVYVGSPGIVSFSVPVDETSARYGGIYVRDLSSAEVIKQKKGCFLHRSPHHDFKSLTRANLHTICIKEESSIKCTIIQATNFRLSSGIEPCFDSISGLSLHFFSSLSFIPCIGHGPYPQEQIVCVVCVMGDAACLPTTIPSFCPPFSPISPLTFITS